MQRLDTGPLPALLKPGSELWLDGGHNPAAGQVLASHIGAHWRDRPLFLVVGMLGNKDAAAFLLALVPVAAGVITVTIPQSAASFSADELARLASRPGVPARAAGSVAESLREIAAGHAGPPARVLICGSLYLAGAVLAENAGG
jgi:dihydrofolate synthase/folylpolyglutamate synthase